MNQLIASGLHYRIADFINDAWDFRRFCTCGPRELWQMWAEAQQYSLRLAPCSTAIQTHLEGLLSDYYGMVVPKIMKKQLFVAVRVGVELCHAESRAAYLCPLFSSEYVQASTEVDYRVGHLYAVLKPDAPKVLDWLRSKFIFDLAFYPIEICMEDLRDEAYDLTETNTDMFVTFVWSNPSMHLSAAQTSTLAKIVQMIQPDKGHEPGWWLWNGESASCVPWETVSRSDGGIFARSASSEYKYPWDRA